jgi:hypothetical protein
MILLRTGMRKIILSSSGMRRSSFPLEDSGKWTREGLFKAKAGNEVDAERGRATLT